MKKTPLLIITGPNTDDVDLFSGLVTSYGLKVEEDKLPDYGEVDAAMIPLDQVLDVAEEAGERGVSIVLVNVDNEDDEGILHQLNSVTGQTIDAAGLPDNIYRFHKTDRNLEQDAEAAEWFHTLDINVVLMERLLMKKDAVESQTDKFGIILGGDGQEEKVFVEPYDTIFMVTQVDDATSTMPGVNQMIGVVATVTEKDPYILGKKIDDGEIFDFGDWWREANSRYH